MGGGGGGGRDDPPVEGVRAVDHTADIGIEVEAPSLPELFRRAALGALWMALERESPPGPAKRRVRLADPDLAGLLRSWVREVLYWQEVEGFAAAEIDVTEVGGGAMAAVVEGGPAPLQPVREIKGVTWHGLVVEERPGGWFARLIFDV